jgi:hypothetical protein
MIFLGNSFVFVKFLTKDGPCKFLCAISYHLEELHGTPANCNTQTQAFSQCSMHCRMRHLQLTHCSSCQLGFYLDFYCFVHWQQWFMACPVANLRMKEGIFFPFLSIIAEVDVLCAAAQYYSELCHEKWWCWLMHNPETESDTIHLHQMC